jgi:membrane protease YdiL (CAAX protease family)
MTFCVVTLLVGLGAHVLGAKDQIGAKDEFWQTVIATMGLQIPALAWVALFLRQHKMGWKEAFGLRISGPRAVARGVLAGTLFLPAAWTLQWVSQNVMEWMHLKPEAQAAIDQLQDPTLTAVDKAIYGVIAIVLAPVVEETLFRGILYPAIKQQGRPRLALWGTSLLFATLHFNGLTFLPLLVLALLLVYLYETFQNLLVPVTAHAFFNAANFFVVVFGDQIANHFNLK